MSVAIQEQNTVISLMSGIATSNIPSQISAFPIESPLSVVKVDDGKSLGLHDDVYPCHFRLENLSPFTEKTPIEYSLTGHEIDHRAEDLRVSILTTGCRQKLFSSFFLLLLALLNTSSSLLMSTTFICLNYSRNLQTPSFPMSTITTPILEALDLHFEPSHDVITFSSFILAIGVFTHSTFSWISYGPETLCSSLLLLAQGIGYLLGFNPVELVLCIFPSSVSVWLILNWVLDFLARRRNGSYRQQIKNEGIPVCLV
ncbi:222114f6-46ce-4a4f-b34d-937352f42ee9 [Sclerotinia trifoliorum]|uniref:222114f6-46ce-4a4f-b34d-937352f42ee9 n=1 Tax=Sclerotinia trifoliorum TaxID=28548 RepID=A0A8H2VW09_9HELO|nr:222114f6-46ce-4a4f-b34d-937352f42ee9 [Sclerotinia trifoliorum]